MTYGKKLPIWWSMAWRSTLAAAAAGFVAGFIVGVIAGLVGQTESVAQTWGGIAGFAAAIPVNIWAFRAALIKHNLQPAPATQQGLLS